MEEKLNKIILLLSDLLLLGGIGLVIVAVLITLVVNLLSKLWVTVKTWETMELEKMRSDGEKEAYHDTMM